MAGDELITFGTNLKRPDSPFLPKYGKSLVVRNLENNNNTLKQCFSFKGSSSGMGISVEQKTSEAPKAPKVTPKKVTVSEAPSAKTLSCASCASGEYKFARKGKGYTEYQDSTGNSHYVPDAPERSPEEKKEWLKAIERATYTFWDKANKELAKVTDEEAKKEYYAHKDKYDAEDPKDPSKVPPIERARRDIAARRALNGHKFG